MNKCFDKNIKLLDALVEMYPETSKSSFRQWMRLDRVSLDGEPVRRNVDIEAGSRVEVLPKKMKRDSLIILHQDRDLVVVEKPEGLLSVATDLEIENTLHAKLKRLYPRVWPVHRLDKATSGVMVFALSYDAKEGLKAQFKDHSIYREYVAEVVGQMEGNGTWKCYLQEGKDFHVRVASRGEFAVTHYKVLSSTKNRTRVQFLLETGKKNQIRVQAAHAGFPVVGDKRYGDFQTKKGRMKLHAHRLGFIHPITEKKMSFNVPIPFS